MILSPFSVAFHELNWLGYFSADKAWKVMGIDIEKERKAKKEFLETVVPQWVKEAKANGKLAEDTATKQ